eukprot:scaffold564752_cov31-Prasinocladus_malaysianus.AAC.1
MKRRSGMSLLNKLRSEAPRLRHPHRPSPHTFRPPNDHGTQKRRDRQHSRKTAAAEPPADQTNRSRW